MNCAGVQYVWWKVVGETTRLSSEDLSHFHHTNNIWMETFMSFRLRCRPEAAGGAVPLTEKEESDPNTKGLGGVELREKKDGGF